jgi:hypothetical protein
LCLYLFTGFYACSNDKKDVTDFSDTTRRRYELERNEVPVFLPKSQYKSYNNCRPGDDTCSNMMVTYELLTNTDNKDRINKAITDSLTKNLVIAGDKAPASIDEALSRFIDSYTLALHEGESMPWTFTVTGKPAFSNKKMFSYAVSGDYFTGGAHPNYFTVYYNFDLHKGRAITLNDIFKFGFEDMLNEAIERNFRKAYDIKPGESLKEWGLFENIITYNNNFSVTDSGIKFTYNPYEIAPYAAGTLDVVVPFAEIQEKLLEFNPATGNY